MNACCTNLVSGGASPWTSVLESLGAVASEDLPAQLLEGETGLLDFGGLPLGTVATSFSGGSPTVWTENWVASSDDVFVNPSRTTTLHYLQPQPAPPQARPSGYVEATMVFSYQPGGNTPNAAPPGVFVFDVFNGPQGGLTLRGRLFRRVTGNQSQDTWLLYPGYVKPVGNTITQLRPNGGDPGTSWTEARAQCTKPGGMYVPIQYVRAPIP